MAQERAAITALILAHVPLMFVEGILTAMLVTFLQRVRPELLGSTAEKPVGERSEPLPVAGGK